MQPHPTVVIQYLPAPWWSYLLDSVPLVVVALVLTWVMVRGKRI